MIKILKLLNDWGQHLKKLWPKKRIKDKKMDKLRNISFVDHNEIFNGTT